MIFPRGKAYFYSSVVLEIIIFRFSCCQTLDIHHLIITMPVYIYPQFFIVCPINVEFDFYSNS